MPFSLLSCQACIEAFKSAGGDAVGFAIGFMLIIVAGMMVGIGYCMSKIGKKQKENMPDKYRDPLHDY